VIETAAVPVLLMQQEQASKSIFGWELNLKELA
jgi:hypothetical protein